MKVTQDFAEQASRHKYHGRGLNEKDELHDTRENRVGDYVGDACILVDLRLAVFFLIGNVGNLLVAQQIEDLAQHKHGQDPHEREDEPNRRVEVIGDVGVARLAD